MIPAVRKAGIRKRLWTSKQYTGWPARIVQHEVDHLGGTLYLDRAVLRSLSTIENYLASWAGRDMIEVSKALGFDQSTA